MPIAHNSQKQEILIDSYLFSQAESKIMSEITELTKSLLNTFKFQMVYHVRVSPETEAKTLQLVKEYRKEKKNHKNYLKEVFPSQ